jgi:sec-independent protein translocase protein TatB
MFDSIGWGEILVLLMAGLFIFGPERLPQAASWLGKAARQARGYAEGARDQMRTEFGSELDELREPLAQLRSLRKMDPKQAITHHLLDDYDPTDDLNSFDIRLELSLDKPSADGDAGEDHPTASRADVRRKLSLDKPAAGGDRPSAATAAERTGVTPEPAGAGHSRPRPPVDDDAT